MAEFEASSRVPASADDLFRWHARPGAFQRLVPPWETVEVVSGGDSLSPGSRVELAMRLGPLKLKWIAEHTQLTEGREFQDVQQSGPFASWTHTHTMFSEPDGTSRLRDRIEYHLPFGRFGELVAGRAVRRHLQRVFRHRHRITIDDLRQHQQAPRNATMKILVTGSSGLVGSALVPFLTTGGHEVVRLVRGEGKSGTITWSPANDTLDPAAIEGFDAVVHLAGENIGEGRWTDAKKREIRESRVRSTRLLAKTLASLKQPPKVLVSASAIGYYGDRGEELLTEDSPPGNDFLADVCREWEAAADEAREAGLRVVHLRTGVVLSPNGGALAKMLLPFKLGLGGVIGSGKQYWSWIALDDLVGVIHHALINESVSGPLNAVAPHAVTNREFTRTLGTVLRRPTRFPLPGVVARTVLGEMARPLLLSSAQVRPVKLEQTGYLFRFPELEPALRHALGRSREPA